jgi:hypothetical protein
MRFNLFRTSLRESMESYVRVDAFYDDAAGIPDDAVLYRRIRPGIVTWPALDSEDEPSIPRQGLQDYPDVLAREKFELPGACMSVAREKVLSDYGYAPKKLIEEYPTYGVISMTAGAVRQLGSAPPGIDWRQGVMPDPRPPDEPWHAVVYWPGGKKTRGIETALAKVSKWVILPQRTATE